MNLLKKFLGWLFVIEIVIIFYSVIAGIWGFNPTEISHFNLKLFLTDAILMIITLTIGYFIFNEN